MTIHRKTVEPTVLYCEVVYFSILLRLQFFGKICHITAQNTETRKFTHYRAGGGAIKSMSDNSLAARTARMNIEACFTNCLHMRKILIKLKKIICSLESYAKCLVQMGMGCLINS